MPQPTSNGQIKLNDYESIKSDKEGFLDNYLFIILFVLLSLMTLLMQYLTIAKIYDDYNDIEEGLTFERIEFINDTIQEHETILAEHEQQVAELMADSTREKKSKDRKFQEVGEAIAITHKQKMIDTRAKTVKRIANNTYVPQDESKAGFVYNPFTSESSNQSVNHSVKPKEEKKIIEVVLDGRKKIGIDDVLPHEFRGEERFYVLKHKDRVVTPINFTSEWVDFIENTEHHEVIEVSEDTLNKGKWTHHFLYYIKVIKNNNQSVKPNSYNQKSNEPLNGSRYNEEQKNNPQNDQPLNGTVITDEKETKPLNDSVKRIDLKEYSNADLELIDLLWKQSTVKRNEQLETRDNVLKIIGDNKNNTLRLRNLYKKLLADKYIYKKVSYFAKVEL